jgi:hypothetical protein
MSVLTIALYIGLLSLALAVEVEIALEAELATVIQAPVVVGVPQDANDAGGPEPDEPSRGQFVWQPGPPVTGGGGQGFMQFVVDIPEEDEYVIWARVIAWDGNSDSFWVTVAPPDPADENPQQTQNTEYRWSPAQGNTWHWDRIDQWLNGGTFDRKWEIPQGDVTITIWSREDATMLDCLFITNEADAVSEAQANVRLPTDEDVEFQKTGNQIAVSTEGKLSTTWASIKGK